MGLLSVRRDVDVDKSFLDLGEPCSEPWCLTFSNTIGGRNSSSPSDRFQSLQDLRTWLSRQGILQDDASSIDDPKNLERGIRLREAIYNIGSAVAAKRLPDDDDLSELNWNVQRAIVSARLTIEGDKIAWDLSSQRGSVAGCLGLIALSAAGLFTSSRATKIRECGNHECGWLFLDLSKNHSRKWCDMSDCGNLAKARRYYAKQKALRAAAT